MKPTHTPGPWEIGRSYSTTHATPVRAKGENLAWVCGLDSPLKFSEAETRANARLISAAPDLLAALEAVADYWQGGDVPADIDTAMRAALKKAKGAA